MAHAVSRLWQTLFPEQYVPVFEMSLGYSCRIGSYTLGVVQVLRQHF